MTKYIARSETTGKPRELSSKFYNHGNSSAVVQLKTLRKIYNFYPCDDFLFWTTAYLWLQHREPL